MKQIITAKLKLYTTKEQRQLLRDTQLAYRDALNFVSKFAFEHGKLSNQRTLQEQTYTDIREKFHLPSQMACNVPRQVGATYQGLWTKVKSNAKALKLGLTKKRYKGLDNAPKYVSPTLTYNYERDFTFKQNLQVSVGTINGRIILDYRGFDKHVELIQQGKHIGASKLYYNNKDQQFYLLVSVEIEILDAQPTSHINVVGVDVGQRYHAVVSGLQGKPQFYSGKEAMQKAEHYHRKRKELQAKGTRSATRKFIQFSGRERRFQANVNHCVSKQIVASNPNSVIGLEDLAHIRERTPMKRKGSKKQRRAQRRKAKWSFADLHSKTAYKANLGTSMAIKVDADYTSQMCPKCGHTCRENRPNKGLMFICKACGYQLHSDLIGARNIAMRTLLVRQDWMRTGCLSATPDVSDKEAKAGRLKRYSELRWSPETNLCL